MTSYLIKDYLVLCEKFFKALVSAKIAEDDEVLFGILQTSLKKNNVKNKNNNNNKEIMSGCKAIIKTGNRKGEECGKKVFVYANEEFDYCVKHINNQKEEENKQQEKEDILIIKKNFFGNFVFGESGLIIKSSKEKYVVAKEGKSGEWLPLSEEDIMLCKKFHLRYKIIDLSFKGETTNKNLIKNIEFYKVNKEKPKMQEELSFKISFDYETGCENNENEIIS
jgi:hypothetical protein